MVILLDMDELLSDFIGGVCRLFGVTRTELEQYRRLGDWSIVKPLCRVLLERNPAGEPLTTNDMWTQIDYEGQGFWRHLKPLPTKKPLLHLAASVGDEWYVVSSPSNHHGCHVGKIEWFKYFVDNNFNSRLILTPNKHLLANKNTVLIDDRYKNIKRFEQAGGKGILFPHEGNHAHKYRHAAIEHVEQSLYQFSTLVS